jgi:hypothetical protein
MNLDPTKKIFWSYWNSIRCFLGIVSLACLLGTSAQAAVPEDEEQIRTTFMALQKAFVAHDGNQALDLISADTKEYYRMLSGIASGNLTLEKLEAEHLTPLNLLMLKHVKRTLPKDFWKDYKKQNPDKLLKYAVEKGLGSQELTNNVRLGVVEISGEIAQGKLIKGPKPLPIQLAFLKESGKWKVSLLSMLDQANRSAEAFLKKSGLNVKDLEKLVLK